jgi:hypothetical protein
MGSIMATPPTLRFFGAYAGAAVLILITLPPLTREALRIRQRSQWLVIGLLGVMAVLVVGVHALHLRQSSANVYDPVTVYQSDAPSVKFNQTDIPINGITVRIPGTWEQQLNESVWVNEGDSITLSLGGWELIQSLGLMADLLGYEDAFDFLKALSETRFALIPALLKSVMLQDGVVYHVSSHRWESVLIVRASEFTRGILLLMRHRESWTILDVNIVEEWQTRDLEEMFNWILDWRASVAAAVAQ